MVLTELIVDGRTDTPIAAFGIDRFGTSATPPPQSLAEEFQDNLLRGLDR
jgi:hypothetical protein